MRTITTNIYIFNELSDSAKEKAREWFKSGDDYDMSDDLNSLKAFCDKYGVSIKEYSIGVWGHSYVDTNAKNSNFRGLKLKIVNKSDMPTGYCMDCILFETFYDEFEETGDALYAFKQAINAWVKSVVAEMEYRLGDEYIDDMLAINSYEFDESGNRI